MEQFVWALALSTHLGMEVDYNNKHPHVRFIEDGAIAGAYYNSVERLSFYTGYRLDIDDFGIELAAVTGYPAFGDIAPYVRGTYDFTDNIRIFAAPSYEDKGDELGVGIVAGIEFMFR